MADDAHAGAKTSGGAGLRIVKCSVASCKTDVLVKPQKFFDSIVLGLETNCVETKSFVEHSKHCKYFFSHALA